MYNIVENKTINFESQTENHYKAATFHTGKIEACGILKNREGMTD